VARKEEDADLFDGELARLLRRRARLTQAELARLGGVTRPTISRWESGERQPFDEGLARYEAVLRRLMQRGGDRRWSNAMTWRVDGTPHQRTTRMSVVSERRAGSPTR
jgi:transcriptional regulator with XRE-family HTH domain